MSEVDSILAKFSEQPVTVRLWSATDEVSLQQVEDDLRNLMHEVADVRFDLEEGAKRNDVETREFLLVLIDIADAFDRVFANIAAKEDQLTPQMKKWIVNFRTVRKKLGSAMSDRHVAAYVSIDQQFDPEWHRVSDTVTDPARGDGQIVAESKPGYLWKESILRKAEVVVVRNER